MLRHSKSGRAFIVVKDADGKRRQVTLGAWGSPEAQRRYHVELAKWHARRRGGEAAAALVAEFDEPGRVTVADAAARWLEFCRGYYRHADGSPTPEVRCLEYALVPLLEMLGPHPLDALTPRNLKLVRERMIHGDPRLPPDRRRGWCRAQANRAIGRIRRFVKWAASEGLVSPMVHAGLTTLAPLKRGRTDAREAPPPKPAADADVEAALRFMPTVVADMVRLQHLVGMRGAELCAMTSAEIDRSETVAPGCWVFRPSHSKLSYRGRVVEYVLGPKAVAIVSRYLRANPAAPLFQPSESEQLRREEMRARRRSKVQPSQVDRSVPNPSKQPGDRYTPVSYGRAIARACARARVHWSPHDLRRAVATRVRARFGIEAARCVVGHQTVEMAQLYAHRDLKVAAEVAREVG